MDRVKNITLREKAAVIFSIITGMNDNITFYSIAKGKEKDINRDSYSSLGYQLKNKDHIKLYYTEAQNLIDNYCTGRINLLNSDDLEGNSFTLKNINFTDPIQFLEYLNNQANTIQNEKDRREYLKLIADLMRFKEGAKGSAEDIQRFYTPENCQNCALYLEQKRKITG